jgi:hypothetical protein
MLLLSAQGGQGPSPPFLQQAWLQPRRPDEIHDIEHVPYGDWLPALVEQAGNWPCAARDALLRWLAEHARDPAVREGCLKALVSGVARQRGA